MGVLMCVRVCACMRVYVSNICIHSSASRSVKTVSQKVLFFLRMRRGTMYGILNKSRLVVPPSSAQMHETRWESEAIPQEGDLFPRRDSTAIRANGAA